METQTKTNKFVGTGVALITPFKEDFSIDFKALRNIVDYIIENGADYIVALGTTSEAPTLSAEEKKSVIDTIINAVNRRCPIILGMGGNDTLALIRQIKDFSFTGIDAILSVTPYYNKPQQNGLISHFTAVADISPIPVVLYNVPGRTGVNMTAETCLKLAKHENVIAIKEASGNFHQIMEILRDKPSDFDVISGDDSITQPLMSLGAIGVISVAANAYTKPFAQMVKAQLQGNFEESLQMHYKLLKMNNLIFADGSPAGIKVLLKQIGLCSDVVRLPLVNVSENVKQLLITEWNTNY